MLMLGQGVRVGVGELVVEEEGLFIGDPAAAFHIHLTSRSPLHLWQVASLLLTVDASLSLLCLRESFNSPCFALKSLRPTPLNHLSYRNVVLYVCSKFCILDRR